MQEMQPQVAHTATSTEFTSIRPRGDRLVLRQTEALAKTKGGIYIPDAAKEKPTEGVVLSVGEGRMNEAGMIVPVSVKVGDTVLFNKFAGQPVVLKEQEFVTAAKALGASSGRIIKHHLLPNCVGQIVVTTCLQIPSAIFLESFLSYLGVGVSAPMTSLGSMASDALSGVQTYGYRLVIPALILSIMILAFNLFGDGLRDALDPRLKK